MNELQLRQSLVNSAMKYLNWSEVNGQDDLIIDKYNEIRTPRYKMNHQDSWCAAFVSVAKHEAGLDSIIPTECGCGEMVKLFAAMNRWEENGSITPQIGDVIFYNWDKKTQPNNNWPTHVGIVISISGRALKVIEGNYSDKVKIRDISIGNGCIRGYGLPDYASLVSYDPQPIPQPEPQPIPTPVPTPVAPVQIPFAVGKTYTIVVDGLRVRQGPGTNYAVLSKKQLTPDGRKHSDVGGHFVKGTKVTCKDLQVVDGNIWMKTPSGWLAATYNGSEYIK